MNVTGKMVKMAGGFQKEIETAFSELIHTRWKGREILWRPPIDIYETDDAFLLVADLPGINPSNIELRFEGHKLTICGIRKSTGTETRRRQFLIERAWGRFCRSLDLSEPVDLNLTKVVYRDGVYEVYLPKKKNDCRRKNTTTES